MTREAEIAEILRNDAEMPTLLPGGIYTYQEVGVEGIRRGEDSPTKDAFDAKGNLKPCAVVVDGNLMPYGAVRNKDFTAMSQTVFIYYYEQRGHEQIVPAKERAASILEGIRLTGTYPIWWVFDSPPTPDVGPVMNATTIRQDWMVVSIRRVAA